MRSYTASVSALLLFLSGGMLLGQTDRGTITGTVTDPAGAVLANAPMELVNQATGALYTTATSGTGNYTFAQLPVGTYNMTVTVPGFKTYNRQNLGVPVAQTIRVDVSMEVGTAAESVTVTAEATLLRTENAELATNVTMSRLNNLPILGVGAQTASSHGIRNPLAASQIQPGVRFVANSIVRVNGAPNNTMGVRLDGQDITNNTAGAAFQAQVQPSLEAVEEVAIQTSNYAAEYGQAGGGLFNYSTRSGSNDYHGSAFDYMVNEALWAAQPFNHIRPEQRRHNYGGSIGGPIRIPKIYDGRDRTFFFFNYEDFRENIFVNNVVVTVPIQPYKGGNFSSILTGRAVPGIPADGLGNPIREGMIYDPLTETLAADGTRARLQFAGNIIPTNRIDPSAARTQALFPDPNFGGAGALINNYNNPYPSNRKTPIPALKLDHNLSDKMKASFYWSTNETSVQYCAQQCGSFGLPLPIEPTRGTFIEAYTLRANFDYTVAPTVLLHFGAGLLSNDFKDNAPVIGYNMEQELGIRGGLGGDIGRFPQMTGLAGPQSLGGMANIGPGPQARNLFLKPTFNTSASWVTGNHTYKFGGELRLEGYPSQALTSMNGAFAFAAEQTTNSYLQGRALGGTFVGFPYASFLLGRVNSVTIGPPATGRSGRSFWGFFAQDTWKVTRKLTLDYGLRWDYFTYPREQYGRSPGFDPLLANATAGGHPGATIFEATCNCRFGNNYKHAWGPRLGMAYQIDSKTVFRAGVGVSYSMSPGGLGQTGVGVGRTQTVSSPNFGDPGMVLSQGVPIRPTWPDMRADLFPAPGTITGSPSAIDPQFGRPARMTQYSVSLQREINNNLVVEGSYVGNRGAWWMTGSLIQPNVLDPAVLRSNFGLDWAGSQADRNILAAQVNSAAAGRFRNMLPYSGFPATATVAQSLRPFPQFGNLGVTGSPMGNTWYDAFQAKVTKRYSYGLDFTLHYTFAKELQLGAESDTGGGVINDILNRGLNKQWSGSSRPHWTVLAANYTLQKYFGNRWLNLAMSDWTIGAVVQYGSGLPITTPGNISNNNGTTLGRGTYATRVPGQPLYLVDDINCGCFDYGRTIILNPDAWTDTPVGQFSPSAAYYNDFRQMRRPQELMSLARNFRFGRDGRYNFMIRAEFNNIFNRTLVMLTNTSGFVDPSTARNANFVRNPQGLYTAGFGTINTTGNIGGQRQGTLVARFTF